MCNIGLIILSFCSVDAGGSSHIEEQPSCWTCMIEKLEVSWNSFPIELLRSSAVQMGYLKLLQMPKNKKRIARWFKRCRPRALQRHYVLIRFFNDSIKKTKYSICAQLKENIGKDQLVRLIGKWKFVCKYGIKEISYISFQ